MRGSNFEQFLVLVSDVCKRHPECMEWLDGMRGRTLVYLARRPDKIRNPVRVPGTEWWVPRNLSHNRMAHVLGRIMDVLPKTVENWRWLRAMALLVVGPNPLLGDAEPLRADPTPTSLEHDDGPLI